MNKQAWVLAIVALIVSSLACGVLSRPRGGSDDAGSSGYNTKFPLPASVVNFTDTGNQGINFQTKMSLQDTLQFYRDALGKQGLKERSVNTAITEQTFSLIFDGDPGGKAVVVQGVDLGNGLTNVNIRYEDV